MTATIQVLPEDVIRKIKAGEVIVRPFNAVKELIENSLDAKATHIVVKIKGGGKDTIQVQDNGIGISKGDLMIAFQKHTTSKLSTFDDITKLTTYGFRGEALSSMADVSQLTIVSRVKSSVCGYKVSITEGVPETKEPVPLAANPGTTITINQLFFNMPIRRRSLKPPNEEYNSILELITKYAVHCSNFVSFVLEKEEARICDVQTMIDSQTIDNIRLLYGKEVAANVTPIMATSNREIFSCTGFISQVNHSMKKMVFILFINDRLVDCAPLKKSIEVIYSNFLLKGSHPFVYLSIKLDPANLDVNVHPSKNEVRFLYEEHILIEIKSAIECKLSNSTTSRLINTTTTSSQSKLLAITYQSSTSDPTSSSNKSNTKPAGQTKRLAITYPSPTTSPSSSSSNKLNSTIESISLSQSNATSPKIYPSQKVRTDAKNQTIHEIWQRNQLCLPSGENMIVRQIKLDSIKELRKEVVNQCDDELHRLIKDSCLVGVVSKNLIAIQHDTKMILTDIQQLTYHLFYQIYLQDFGNFAMLEFDEPHNVETLYEMFETQRSQESLEPDSVRTKLTREHIRNMIDDYFSLEITKEGQICTLPVLLNGYYPNPYNLPRFINDLVHQVDWKSEKPCFRTFGQSLAKLYQASYLDYESHDDWVKTVTSILYPKIKSYLKPSADLNNLFTVITTTNELYKVFERC